MRDVGREVGPGDDAEELAFGVHDQEPADALVAEPFHDRSRGSRREPPRRRPCDMMSLTGRPGRRSPCAARARATSRSVRTPTGLPSSRTGTAPQSASRKIRTASSTVLKEEQVRGFGRHQVGGGQRGRGLHGHRGDLRGRSGSASIRPIGCKSRTRPAHRRRLAQAGQVDLNGYLSISYWLILPETLRRDSPQSSAQRPTFPRLFSSALRMYCRSICSVAILR